MRDTVSVRWHTVTGPPYSHAAVGLVWSVDYRSALYITSPTRRYHHLNSPVLLARPGSRAGTPYP
jgi:hypothetical protein